MAKGNLLLGMGRGSIGDVTLYRQNGQQMSRARNRVVKNPKTGPQMIQRMIAATIGYAYSGLKEIVDHSFEGVAYGGPSMNMFRRLNMDKLRQVAALEAKESTDSYVAGNVSFAMKGVRTIYPFEYAIARGSLPKINFGLIWNKENQDERLIVAPAPFTVGNLMSAWGAQLGDQVTFVVLNDNGSRKTLAEFGEGRKNVTAIALAIRRIKFLTSYSSEQLSTVITADNFETLFDMEVTSPFSSMDFAAGDQTVTFGVPGVHIIAATIVLSRNQNGTWLRSNADMTISEGMYSNYTEDFGLSFANAYASWMAGTEAIGVSSYILNGKPNEGVNPEVDDEGGGDNP